MEAVSPGPVAGVVSGRVSYRAKLREYVRLSIHNFCLDIRARSRETAFELTFIEWSTLFSRARPLL